jgi:hypothetical protein
MTTFENFIPALATQGSPDLKTFGGVNLSLKGSISSIFDADFRPHMTHFKLSSGSGAFATPELYTKPVPIKNLSITGYLDLQTWEGAIEQCSIDLGGPHAEATLQSTIRNNVKTLNVQATLFAMPIDNLQAWWPESIAHSARNWVTRHLSMGLASKATLDMEASLNKSALSIDKLGGQIDFAGVKVDYFPPLMPVSDVDGSATYDKSTFDLNLKNGTLGDMKVKKSFIHISGLDTTNEPPSKIIRTTDTAFPKIDVNVSLHGPLKTALKVLDSKPLEYPKDLGIETAEVGGMTDIDVNFKFPLHNALTLQEVQVQADANLNNVLLKNTVKDLPLTGGPIDLAFSNGAMTVKGAGKLGDMPVTFNWLRNFTPDAPISNKIEAKLSLTPSAMRTFGIPDTLGIGGEMPSDIIYTADKHKAGTLLLKGDLASLSFEVPLTGLKKDANVPGNLAFALKAQDGKPQQITDLTLSTGKTSLQGNILLDAAGIRTASFPHILFGDTNISLSAAQDTGGGYTVKVSGKQADLSQFLQSSDKSGSDAEAAQKTSPLTLSLNVDHLLTGKDKSIDAVKAYLRRNEWQRIEQLELDGTAQGGTMALRYLPVAGGHSLHFQADNAGAALRTLGITNSVRRGRIIIDGKPWTAHGSRDIAGTVIMTDFVLVDAPVLARLLNALSLTGIIDLMNGKGISFKKMRSEFFWTDLGTPAQQKNVRNIQLKNGETSGSSLGLTFEGNIDEWNKTFDLSGTIIPISDINKVLASIPLVGNILTGGSGTVFAATYTLKGSKNDPNVVVNPLAVLAPGLLRKLFFEK